MLKTMRNVFVVFLIVFITKFSGAFSERPRREVYNENCGIHSAASGLSMNGIGYERGLWPWNVAVFDIHPRQHFCGSVMISRTFVVTAAHCLHSKHHSRKEDSNIMLIFGAYSLKNNNEPGAVSEYVKKSYIHEDWNTKTTNYDADIALLEVVNPIEYSNYIKPICLWLGAESLIDAEGTVVGWGANKFINESSDKPLGITVPIIKKNSQCWLDVPKLKEISSDRTFCGGARDGVQIPCYGDSGSGLYVKSEKRFYLKGLVSSSSTDMAGTCDATIYSIYTNIFMFTEWIRKTADIGKTVPSRCYMKKLYGYSCEVSAHIKRETDVLNFLESHLDEKTDNDVVHLNLDNSIFNVLPAHFFQNFNKLTNLKMWNVKLGKITDKSFTSCPNLTALGLRFNRLAKLPNGAFKELKNLIGLGVNCNPITEIENDAFIGLDKLEYLFLCSNKVTEIFEETFEPLIGLKMLHLNQTLIRRIDPNAFKSMHRLWYLNLGEGLLTNIDAFVFKPLKKLRYLLLNNNLIDFIHEDAFQSLTKLKVLTLRENKLLTLFSLTFLSQAKLEQLSVKDNKIWFMQKGTFDNLKSLIKLDARGNACVDELHQNTMDFDSVERKCPDNRILADIRD